jgi:hypothetical protein
MVVEDLFLLPEDVLPRPTASPGRVVLCLLDRENRQSCRWRLLVTERGTVVAKLTELPTAAIGRYGRCSDSPGGWC